MSDRPLSTAHLIIRPMAGVSAAPRTYHVPAKDFAGTSFWLPLREAPTPETLACCVLLPTGKERSVSLRCWTAAGWRMRQKPVPACLILLTETEEVFSAVGDGSSDPMEIGGHNDDGCATEPTKAPFPHGYLAHREELFRPAAAATMPWEDFERLAWTYVQLLVEMTIREKQDRGGGGGVNLPIARLMEVYASVMQPEARAILVRLFILGVVAPALNRAVDARQAESGGRDDDTIAFCHLATHLHADPLVRTWWRLERKLVQATVPSSLAADPPASVSEHLALGTGRLLLLQRLPNTLPPSQLHAHRHEQALRTLSVRAAWRLRASAATAPHEELVRMLALGAAIAHALYDTVCADRPIDFFERGYGFRDGAYRRPGLLDADIVERERERRRQALRERARARANGEWVVPADGKERRERAAAVGSVVADLEDLFSPGRTPLPPCMGDVFKRARDTAHLRDPERQAVVRWLVNLAPERSPADLVRVVFPLATAAVAATPERRRELEAGMSYAKREYLKDKTRLPQCGYIIAQTLDRQQQQARAAPPLLPRCPYAQSPALPSSNNNSGTARETLEERCQRACSQALGFPVANPVDAILHAVQL